MLIGTSLDIVNTTLGGTGMNSGAISEPALDALTFAQDFEDSVGTGTFTRASNAWNPDTGELCADNVPRYVAGRSGKGILVEPSATNYFLNSTTPVTQDISVTTASSGKWTCSVYGNGSVTSSAGTATATGYGTATAGYPNTITVTGNGTVTYTVNSADATTKVQVENSSYPTSNIVTTGTTYTRVADGLTHSPVGVLGLSQGTIGSWIKIIQALQANTIRQIFHHYSTPGKDTIIFRKNSSAQYTAILSNSAGTLSTASQDIVLSDGWHHIAMTWNSSELALWIDGIKCTVANGFTNDPITNPVIPSVLGSAMAVGSTLTITNQVTMPIDNLRIYNRPLTAAEMNQLFRSGGGIMRDTQLKVTTDGDLFASNGDYIFVRS